jgi:hypothetical protein
LKEYITFLGKKLDWEKEIISGTSAVLRRQSHPITTSLPNVVHLVMPSMKEFTTEFRKSYKRQMRMSNGTAFRLH